MEGKIVPPDEKQWTEQKDFFEEKFLDEMFFYRLKTYFNDGKPNEGLLTLEFMDAGIVLKCHGISSPGKEIVDKYFYLLLSDGRWTRSLPNTEYKVEVNRDIRGKEIIMRLTITIRTDGGFCRRIIRKKVEDKK